MSGLFWSGPTQISLLVFLWIVHLSCVCVCGKTSTISGIDIDWEYPGYVPHSGTSADTENFILLLRTVRSALDALGSQTGKYYGLTAALPCGPSNIANQDIQQVAEILDELNLMTYDFHGSWDSITGHNAPLFDQPQGDHESGWSVHGCVENWVGSTSSPDYPNKEAHRAKVNIGLPFYGRSYLDTTELYMPHGGNDEYSWYDDGGVPQYFHIKTKLDEGELRSVRDETTKTPYAYFTNGYGMVSYDDPRSVCDKAEYVVDEGLGGFIICEYFLELKMMLCPILYRLHLTYYVFGVHDISVASQGRYLAT